MKITRGFLIAAIVGSLLLFWIPAYFVPDDTRNGVNAAFFILSIITAAILSVDIYDVIRTNGEGISWQAALGKIGIFMMTSAFALISGWALLVSLKGFPTELVRSPIGTYLRFLQGIGLGALFLGLSDPEATRPRINTSVATAIVLVCGIIIGFALGHVPFLTIND